MAFIIASDDVKWCRKHLLTPNAVVDVFGTDKVYATRDFHSKLPASVAASHFDLAMMASCTHSIYDYGTFGYWGAFLSGGSAVYVRMRDDARMMKNHETLEYWTALDT